MKYIALCLSMIFSSISTTYADSSSSVYGYSFSYYVIDKSLLLKYLGVGKPIISNELKSISAIYGRCGTRNDFTCNINTAMKELYAFDLRVNSNNFEISVWDLKQNKKASLVTNTGIPSEWVIYQGSTENNLQITEKLNKSNGELVTVFYRHTVRR